MDTEIQGESQEVEWTIVIQCVLRSEIILLITK